jgi:hypothetical protein
MSLTANNHAAELIADGRIVEDILTNAAQSRKDNMVGDRMQYHMGAVFLTKKSRNTINAPALWEVTCLTARKAPRSPVAL